MKVIVEGTNKRRYAEAVIHGEATDIFLAPVFKARECYLWYDAEGRLEERMLPCSVQTLKRSGVKRHYDPLPGFKQHFRWTWVVGHLFTVKDEEWFVATGIRVSAPKGDHNAHGMNRALQLHVLEHRGFCTVAGLCSWLTVVSRSKEGGPVVRELPRKSSLLEEQCQERLNQIKWVWSGRQRYYWQKPKKPSKLGQRFSCTMPVSLEFAAAAGHNVLW